MGKALGKAVANTTDQCDGLPGRDAVCCGSHCARRCPMTCIRSRPLFYYVALATAALVASGCLTSVRPPHGSGSRAVSTGAPWLHRPPGARYNATVFPVSDGDVVLVKKGNAYGAFILRHQQPGPEMVTGSGPPPAAPTQLVPRASERVEYTWYFRSDGRGTFQPSEERRVERGYAKKAARTNMPPFRAIRFGPFSVGWSSASPGYGWLYYPRFNDEEVLRDDQRFCVTGETDITRIDARDHRWVYKGSPADPGVYADGSKVEAKSNSRRRASHR